MLVNLESGNMLIMSLSYTRATNDKSLITKNYNLLDQWTQFLVNDSLIPAEQYVMRCYCREPG